MNSTSTRKKVNLTVSSFCHDYHDDSYFGLARCDHKFTNAKKSEWLSPSRGKERENERMVENLITVDENNDQYRITFTISCILLI